TKDKGTLRNRAPLSQAIALASKVLPHPGGPYKRIPLGAWYSLLCENLFKGLPRSACKLLWIFSIISSYPPMSSNETLISRGWTAEKANSSSYLLSVSDSSNCNLSLIALLVKNRLFKTGQMYSIVMYPVRTTNPTA